MACGRSALVALCVAAPCGAFVLPASSASTAAAARLALRASARSAAEDAAAASAPALSASAASPAGGASWGTAASVAVGVALGVAASCRRGARRGEKKVGRSSSAVAMLAEEKRFPILTKRPPVGSFPKLPASVYPGVVTGKALEDLLEYAKETGFAIPAVNCVSSSSINACLEAARAADAPIMIQFSSGGSQFYGGKGLDNTGYHAAIAGAVSGAYHTRAMAEQYGVPVILHTDHCSKALLPWLDGLLEADERYFAIHGEPLFSSHMLDLSEEPLEENIEICATYLERMAKMKCSLEMELGITGGEEDGVNNENANPEDLYSKPEEIWQVYQRLSQVPGGVFTIAAAFGNVHGVYKPGNVSLKPTILRDAQIYIADKLGAAGTQPVKFVFHGGSGSELGDIRDSLGYGVIKMNIDTDTQWSYWKGIKDFEEKYHGYLQGQIGNPDGEEKPNKKYYDPRACLRSAEVATKERLMKCFEDLRCVDRLGLGPPAKPDNVLGPRRGGLPC